MIRRSKPFWLAVAVLLGGAPGRSFAETDPHVFIDNGEVRLGIDLSAGGSIFHFGESDGGANLLNHYDKGRFIQQSYYGDEDGSRWAGRPWRWNPVQGGGYRDEPAEVLAFDVEETRLRVRSIPRHWATGEPVDSTRMVSMIRLDGPVAHIRFAFQYNGDTAHASRHQELPAVFVDADYPYLVRYDGDAPWTGGELSRDVPGWPNERREATEHWAAYVDEEDFGIGVFFPGTDTMTTYRFEGNGTAGPTGSACSYFSPIRSFAVTPGLRFQYDVYLTIGSVDEIRARFHALAEEIGSREEAR